MNFEELDRALRSVLLQYMRDPEVIGIIKNNVNTGNAMANSVVQTTANNAMQVSTCSQELISKLDEILSRQQKIESLINSVSQNNGSWNITEEDFKNAKNKYESEITKLKSEHECAIKEYQNRNQLLVGENSELKSRNDELEQREVQFIAQVEELKTEISRLGNQCESELHEKEKIQKEYDSLESQYSVFVKQLEIWNSIKSLNNENKEYLEKLCGSENVMPILSLGRDEGKVEQLWFYLRDLVVKGNQAADQIEILAEYFEFCIDLSNACKVDEEKYCIFDIEPGDEFDMDMCIRSADSKQIGNVSRTIVRGVKEGEKVRFKAIVSVK